jgi:GTPase
MQHKAGFVNIIGNPNVGKSTLMNALVGEKISIITSKAQTTRHRIIGIVNGEDFQMVYSDTPGILKPVYSLQDSMLNFVKEAFVDADVILYVTDTVENIEKNEEFIAKINQTKVPVIVLINKIDLCNQEMLEQMVNDVHKKMPNAEILPVSALHKTNITVLFDKIKKLLPESEPYFPKDQLTDKPERFFVSEIFREKILKYYDKEIPYCCEVVVDEFKDEEKITRISVVIYVARESQKGIVIGHKGFALKKTATEARKDIEEFLGKKVFLETFVKVKKNWRDDNKTLKQFGY